MLKEALFESFSFIIKKPSFTFFVFSVGVFSLICSVYSDIIIAQNYHIFTLPWHVIKQSVFSHSTPVYIQENEAGNNDRTLYIFALDVSETVSTGSDKNEWYKEARNDIKKFCPEVALFDAEGLSRWNLVISRLSLLIKELSQSTRTTNFDYFSIWAMGRYSFSIFPSSSQVIQNTQGNLFEELNRNTVRRAIIRLHENFAKPDTFQTDGFDQHTDFVSLFKEINDQYYKNLNKEPKFDSIVLTIISDFIHDPKTEGNETKISNFNSEIGLLFNQLSEKGEFRINMVVFTQNQEETENSPIIIQAKNSLNFYQRQIENLTGQTNFDEISNSEIQFKKIQSKSTTDFFYTDPYDVQTMSSEIQSENSKWKIELPEQFDDRKLPRINLEWQIIDPNGIPLSDASNRGVLTTGRDEREIFISTDLSMRLKYNDRLREFDTNPILKLSFEDELETYYIPVNFVKTLPDGAAYWMCLLQM